MNNYSRFDVMQISEQLHLCMVKAIDTALTNRSGKDWFEKFKDIDSKSEKPILEKHYTSVHSMDMQSCFKFFRFGEDHAKIVFEYYGNNFYIQNQDAQRAEKQLIYLLNNLMNNVRNEVYAHASASMIENGAASVRYSVYGYNEAVNDMIKFASFFKQVTDNDGISYYEKMLSMTHVKNSYSIANTIKQENLKTDAGTFVTACNNLGIGISTSNNGELSFISSNYAGDLAQITLYLNRKQSRKSKTVLIVIAVVVIAVACAVALIFGLSGKNNDNNKQVEPRVTTSQAVATTAEPVPTEEETIPPTDPPTNGTHMYGEGSYAGLTFKVDQELDNHIEVLYENGENQMKIGTPSAYFIIETESGKHYSETYEDFDFVAPYSTGEIKLDYEKIDEKIVSITCDSVINFSGRGSSGKEKVIIPIEYK